MLKGLNPVVVQVVSFSLGLEKFSWLPVLATSLIAAGTATTAATGVSAVPSFGLLVHLASHICEALKVCMAQLYMCEMQVHQLETLRLMSSTCTACLIVAVALFEWSSFVEHRGWDLMLAHPLWYLAAGAPPAAYSLVPQLPGLYCSLLFHLTGIYILPESQKPGLSLTRTVCMAQATVGVPRLDFGWRGVRRFAWRVPVTASVLLQHHWDSVSTAWLTVSSSLLDLSRRCGPAA